MNAYLIVAGAIFGLIGIAHLPRLFFEGHALSDPWFLGGTWRYSRLGAVSQFGRLACLWASVAIRPTIGYGLLRQVGIADLR